MVNNIVYLLVKLNYEKTRRNMHYCKRTCCTSGTGVKIRRHNQ